MKSILLTFVIFAVVFGLVEVGLFDLIASSYFHYFALISLIAVFGAAVYFVGLPKINSTNRNKGDEHDEN